MIVRPTDDHSIVQHINMCSLVIREVRERRRERETKEITTIMCI